MSFADWLKTPGGAKAADHTTLPKDSTAQSYLENRLWAAWMAGQQEQSGMTPLPEVRIATALERIADRFDADGKAFDQMLKDSHGIPCTECHGTGISQKKNPGKPCPDCVSR